MKVEKEEVKAVEEDEPSAPTKEARANLKNALTNVESGQESQEPTEASEEEEEDEEEDEEEEKFVPAKVIKREEKPPKIVKTPAHASYIMKLFDRSVNLARFNEETPLFPLCRAWMRNNPRAVPSKHDAENESRPVMTVEEGDVVEMPRVRIRKASRLSVARKDNKLDKTAFDKAIDAKNWTKEKLLSSHMVQWQEIRQKQIDSTWSFEEKHFSANLELLMSLHKDNEE